MRIYIANAMTGMPNYNFDWFDRARDYLVSLGHDPISPADMDRDVGFDGEGEAPAEMTLASCLRRDFAAITDCDAIAFGPDWATSRGARAERQIGGHIGCQFWRVDPDAGYFYREAIIGLAGYARAGKDTVAQIVKQHGFEQRAFAAPLKACLAALDPIVLAYGPHDMQRLSDYLNADSGWEAAKSEPEVRQLLQRLGTEAGRNILGDDVWVNALFQTPSRGRLVISDVRFPNEAAAIRDRGGVLVRITRPGHGPVNGHPSETALDDYDFDAEILNDGEIADLKPAIDSLVASL